MAEIRTLTAAEQLDEAFAASSQRPVWLFKHSLTCPISSRAWHRYQRFVEDRPADDETLYTAVMIQQARPLSNDIAERTGVRHESPQAILLRDGRAVWNASHGAITEGSLAGAGA
ncbi:MAG: bacillithiol system redox-active protein YtxJ [Acidobacteriota bacterium]